MAIAWSALRDYIRTSVLKDAIVSGADPQFSNDALLIAARWACASISQHTAQAATIVFNGDGALNTFTLPSNIVDGVEKAALVIHNDGENLEYLAPIRLIPGGNWPTTTPGIDQATVRGYWEWPQGTLVLSFVPAIGSTIEVRYFKVWDVPTGDSSTLAFPLVFEQPFAYLVGAIALDPLGAQASIIRTWNTRTDSGTPEDNALQRQSEFFLKMAQQRLRDIGPQDRETFYHKSPRDYGFER
jgi:hypothetical protein